MTASYTNTIVLTHLLFCLFTTSFSSSARSYIRQFTDDFNTTLQQEVGAGLIQNLNHEAYLRDDRVSALNPVRGFRDQRPSSYSVQINSYNTLFRHSGIYFESRPFAVGGYNWKLFVNCGHYANMYISLYVAIDSSSPLTPQQEVHADLRFYIYNKNERKYFTIQDTDVWKFSASNPKWGIPQIISVDTFKDPKNGYVYDVDQCEFGVDVIIPSDYQKSELLSIKENLPNRIFTYVIQRFSTQIKESYQSDVFSIGDRSWTLLVYPNGYGSGVGKALSMLLSLNWDSKFSLYEKVFIHVSLRVINQRKVTIDYGVDFVNWFSREATIVSSNVISLAFLNNPANGFFVNDMLKVEVEILAISSSKFLPN